jgi:hypothetical protein
VLVRCARRRIRSEARGVRRRVLARLPEPASLLTTPAPPSVCSDICRRDICRRDICRRDICRRDICRRDICRRDICRRDICRRDLCRGAPPQSRPHVMPPSHAPRHVTPATPGLPDRGESPGPGLSLSRRERENERLLDRGRAGIWEAPPPPPKQAWGRLHTGLRHPLWGRLHTGLR